MFFCLPILIIRFLFFHISQCKNCIFLLYSSWFIIFLEFSYIRLFINSTIISLSSWSFDILLSISSVSTRLKTMFSQSFMTFSLLLTKLLNAFTNSSFICSSVKWGISHFSLFLNLLLHRHIFYICHSNATPLNHKNATFSTYFNCVKICTSLEKICRKMKP